MRGPRVLNMGCRLNALESEVMQDLAGSAGVKDAIIFNTCAVTAEAERQARQMIRREKRNHPKKRIVVSGCAAQLNPELFASMPEVDHVLGNDEKLRLKNWERVKNGLECQVSDIMHAKELNRYSTKKRNSRIRGFMQIQQGCDHRCTFCIIPFARGISRSVPLKVLIQQANNLVKLGYKEITVTGVDICSYGKDFAEKMDLGVAIGLLLDAVPAIKRLRLTSLDPAAIDEKLIDLLKNQPRLMPHVHLSIQALDNVILKRMKRRHSVEDTWGVIERIRDASPNIAIGADLIAGFPTESDQMFDNALSILKDMDIPFLHVFPYSERAGTPAARMPLLPISLRKERAALLRNTGKRMMKTFLRRKVGSVVSILIEAERAGRATFYSLVDTNEDVPVGETVRVLITGFKDNKLLGKILYD